MSLSTMRSKATGQDIDWDAVLNRAIRRAKDRAFQNTAKFVFALSKVAVSIGEKETSFKVASSLTGEIVFMLLDFLDLKDRQLFLAAEQLARQLTQFLTKNIKKIWNWISGKRSGKDNGSVWSHEDQTWTEVPLRPSKEPPPRPPMWDVTRDLAREPVEARPFNQGFTDAPIFDDEEEVVIDTSEGHHEYEAGSTTEGSTDDEDESNAMGAMKLVVLVATLFFGSLSKSAFSITDRFSKLLKHSTNNLDVLGRIKSEVCSYLGIGTPDEKAVLVEIEEECKKMDSFLLGSTHQKLVMYKDHLAFNEAVTKRFTALSTKKKDSSLISYALNKGEKVCVAHKKELISISATHQAYNTIRPPPAYAHFSGPFGAGKTKWIEKFLIPSLARELNIDPKIYPMGIKDGDYFPLYRDERFAVSDEFIQNQEVRGPLENMFNQLVGNGLVHLQAAGVHDKEMVPTFDFYFTASNREGVWPGRLYPEAEAEAMNSRIMGSGYYVHWPEYDDNFDRNHQADQHSNGVERRLCFHKVTPAFTTTERQGQDNHWCPPARLAPPITVAEIRRSLIADYHRNRATYDYDIEQFLQLQDRIGQNVQEGLFSKRKNTKFGKKDGDTSEPTVYLIRGGPNLGKTETVIRQNLMPMAIQAGLKITTDHKDDAQVYFLDEFLPSKEEAFIDLYDRCCSKQVIVIACNITFRRGVTYTFPTHRAKISPMLVGVLRRLPMEGAWCVGKQGSHMPTQAIANGKTLHVTRPMGQGKTDDELPQFVGHFEATLRNIRKDTPLIIWSDTLPEDRILITVKQLDELTTHPLIPKAANLMAETVKSYLRNNPYDIDPILPYLKKMEKALGQTEYVFNIRHPLETFLWGVNGQWYAHQNPTNIPDLRAKIAIKSTESHLAHPHVVTVEKARLGIKSEDDSAAIAKAAAETLKQRWHDFFETSFGKAVIAVAGVATSGLVLAGIIKALRKKKSGTPKEGTPTKESVKSLSGASTEDLCKAVSERIRKNPRALITLRAVAVKESDLDWANKQHERRQQQQDRYNEFMEQLEMQYGSGGGYRSHEGRKIKEALDMFEAYKDIVARNHQCHSKVCEGKACYDGGIVPLFPKLSLEQAHMAMLGGMLPRVKEAQEVVKAMTVPHSDLEVAALKGTDNMVVYTCGRAACKAIMIRGRLGIAPLHLGSEDINITHGGKTYRCTVLLKREAEDTLLFEVEKKSPEFKDLTPFLIDLKEVYRQETVVICNRRDNVMPYTAGTAMIDLRGAWEKNRDRTHVSNMVLVYPLIDMPWTEKGDCGSLYLGAGKHLGVARIMGMHVWRDTASGRMCGTLLCKELIATLFTLLGKTKEMDIKEVEFVPSPFMKGRFIDRDLKDKIDQPKQMANPFPENDRITYQGTVACFFGGRPGASMFKQAPHTTTVPPMKIPAYQPRDFFKPEVVETWAKDPREKPSRGFTELKKMAIKDIKLTKGMYKWVETEYKSYIENFFTSPKSVRPLTDFEVINGVEAGDRLDAIHGFAMTKSAGLSIRVMTGCTKKSDIFFQGPDGRYHWRQDSKGAKYMLSIIRAWEKDPKPLGYPVSASLKDELISAAKCAKGKIRVFANVCFIELFLTKKYLGFAVGEMQKQLFNNGFTAGIDPIQGFDEMYRQLRMFGNLITFDYSGWDKTVPREVQRLFLEAMTSITDKFYKPEDAERARCIAQCMLDRTESFEGDVYNARGSLASGIYWTNYLNSGMNDIITFLVVGKLLKQRMGRWPTIQEMRQNTRIFHHGDDVIMSVSNDWAKDVNYFAIKRILKDVFGMTITPGNKEGEERDFEPLEETSFLARQPRTLGVITVGALRKESIEQTINFPTSLTAEHMHEIAKITAEEACLWDEEYYNHVTGVVARNIETLRLPKYHFPAYETQRMLLMERVGLLTFSEGDAAPSGRNPDVSLEGEGYALPKTDMDKLDLLKGTFTCQHCNWINNDARSAMQHKNAGCEWAAIAFKPEHKEATINTIMTHSYFAGTRTRLAIQSGAHANYFHQVAAVVGKTYPNHMDVRSSRTNRAALCLMDIGFEAGTIIDDAKAEWGKDSWRKPQNEDQRLEALCEAATALGLKENYTPEEAWDKIIPLETNVPRPGMPITLRITRGGAFRCLAATRTGPCPTVCGTAGKLYEHARNSHPGEPCPLCGGKDQCYTTCVRFERYECARCAQSFDTKTKEANHQRSAHYKDVLKEGVKPPRITTVEKQAGETNPVMNETRAPPSTSAMGPTIVAGPEGVPGLVAAASGYTSNLLEVASQLNLVTSVTVPATATGGTVIAVIPCNDDTYWNEPTKIWARQHRWMSGSMDYNIKFFGAANYQGELAFGWIPDATQVPTSVAELKHWNSQLGLLSPQKTEARSASVAPCDTTLRGFDWQNPQGPVPAIVIMVNVPIVNTLTNQPTAYTVQIWSALGSAQFGWLNLAPGQGGAARSSLQGVTKTLSDIVAEHGLTLDKTGNNNTVSVALATDGSCHFSKFNNGGAFVRLESHSIFAKHADLAYDTAHDPIVQNGCDVFYTTDNVADPRTVRIRSGRVAAPGADTYALIPIGDAPAVVPSLEWTEHAWVMSKARVYHQWTGTRSDDPSPHDYDKVFESLYAPTVGMRTVGTTPVDSRQKRMLYGQKRFTIAQSRCLFASTSNDPQSIQGITDIEEAVTRYLREVSAGQDMYFDVVYMGQPAFQVAYRYATNQMAIVFDGSNHASFGVQLGDITFSNFQRQAFSGLPNPVSSQLFSRTLDTFRQEMVENVATSKFVKMSNTYDGDTSRRKEAGPSLGALALLGGMSQLGGLSQSAMQGGFGLAGQKRHNKWASGEMDKNRIFMAEQTAKMLKASAYSQVFGTAASFAMQRSTQNFAKDLLSYGNANIGFQNNRSMAAGSLTETNSRPQDNVSTQALANTPAAMTTTNMPEMVPMLGTRSPNKGPVKFVSGGIQGAPAPRELGTEPAKPPRTFLTEEMVAVGTQEQPKVQHNFAPTRELQGTDLQNYRSAQKLVDESQLSRAKGGPGSGWTLPYSTAFVAKSERALYGGFAQAYNAPVDSRPSETALRPEANQARYTVGRSGDRAETQSLFEQGPDWTDPETRSLGAEPSQEFEVPHTQDGEDPDAIVVLEDEDRGSSRA